MRILSIAPGGFRCTAGAPSIYGRYLMLNRRGILLVILMIVVIMLGGCTKEYVFDFKARQSLGSGSDFWASNGVLDNEYEFLPGGLRLFYTDIHSSATFTGDFSVEFDFDLLNADINSLNWLEFFITDSFFEDSAYQLDKNFGIGLQATGTPGALYYYGQKNGWVHGTGVPGNLDLDGRNKLEIIKTGNTIKIKINGVQAVDSFQIAPANELHFYRIFCQADYTGTEESAGMLLHSVKVKHEPGALVFLGF